MDGIRTLYRWQRAVGRAFPGLLGQRGSNRNRNPTQRSCLFDRIAGGRLRRSGHGICLPALRANQPCQFHPAQGQGRARKRRPTRHRRDAFDLLVTRQLVLPAACGLARQPRLRCAAQPEQSHRVARTTRHIDPRSHCPARKPGRSEHCSERPPRRCPCSRIHGRLCADVRRRPLHPAWLCRGVRLS